MLISSSGKHRRLQLQIGQLQNQLESTRDHVYLLTTALQAQSSKTPPVLQRAPGSQSSGSVHSSPLESSSEAILDHDVVTAPLMDYVQPDMSGSSHANHPQSYPTEFASEPQLSTTPPSYFQLKISAESQGVLYVSFGANHIILTKAAKAESVPPSRGTISPGPECEAGHVACRRAVPFPPTRCLPTCHVPHRMSLRWNRP